MHICYWIKTTTKRGIVYACFMFQLQVDDDTNPALAETRTIDVDAAPDAWLSTAQVERLRAARDAARGLYAAAADADAIEVCATPGDEASWQDWVVRHLRAAYDLRPREHALAGSDPAADVSALLDGVGGTMRALSREMAGFDLDYVARSMPDAPDGG